MRTLLPALASLLLVACASGSRDDAASRCAEQGCREIVLAEVGDAPWEQSQPGEDENGYPIHLRRVFTLSGAELERVGIGFDDGNGMPFLDVELTEQGGQRMEAFTGERIGSRLALIVDDDVISTPYVQGRFGREFRLTGVDTLENARRIQNYLLGK